MNDGVGHTSQQEAVEPFPSMRGDHYQIRGGRVLSHDRRRIADRHLGADGIL